MPDSLVAILILLAAVVPGFLFLQGYNRGRAQAPAPDIFVVAKAAFASLVFLTLVWALGGFWVLESGSTVVDWVRDGELHEHIAYLLALAWPVFLVAFGAGLLVGWTVEWFGRDRTGRRRHVGSFLEWCGFLKAPTVWASLLEEELQEPKLLLVEMTEGRTVIGAYDGSAVIASDLGEIFLSETFVVDAATGALVPQNRAMYIKGETVRAISMGSL